MSDEMVRTISRPTTHAAIERLCQHVERMHVGVPLPPVAQLRRELKVSQQTIEKAYARLEGRGLIHRQRGKGVFRADPAATGEFAIVLRKQLLSADASPLYRLMATALMEELHAANDQWHGRLHVGMVTETGDQFPSTLDLLDPDVLPRLRGVFSYHALHDVGRELDQRRVPVVHLSARTGIPRVGADRSQFIRHCITHLLGRGCRSVGLIWASQRGDYRNDVFKQLADEYRLGWRENWIRGLHAHSWTERDGYNLFTDLWRSSDRPDGLIVTDDVLNLGVLRATLQFGIDLPGDLRLISFANRDVAMPYHKPVTRVEFDYRQWAKLAVQMMGRLVRRQPLEQQIVHLSGVLVEGQTT